MKNPIQIAKEVLILEGDAVKNTAKLIDDQFERCVQAMLQSKGRVVLTGIGKSAIVATKIAATMNSTGTPALFMHAADAIHGDLGMVQEDDIVVCLSKSGHSPEIKVLVPLIKRRGNILVAMVSHTGSYLAKEADYVLDGTIGEEACPHNLAPTTSTTVHMALGDALAVALLKLKDFSPTDFAEHHPGGALGKKLFLKVNDLVVKNGAPQVALQTPLKDVILEISSKRLGATAVLDANGNIVGIITDGDLRRMLEQHSNIDGVTAKDIMSENPKTIHASKFAAQALKLMEESNITQLIIVDDTGFKGFVHLHDLLKEGIV